MHKSPIAGISLFAAVAGLGFFMGMAAPASADPATASCDSYAQSNWTMIDSDSSELASNGACWIPRPLHSVHREKARKMAHVPAVVAKKPKPEIVVNEPLEVLPPIVRISSIDCYGVRATLLCPGYQLLGISY